MGYKNHELELKHHNYNQWKAAKNTMPKQWFTDTVVTMRRTGSQPENDNGHKGSNGHRIYRPQITESQQIFHSPCPPDDFGQENYTYSDEDTGNVYKVAGHETYFKNGENQLSTVLYQLHPDGNSYFYVTDQLVRPQDLEQLVTGIPQSEWIPLPKGDSFGE